MYYISCLLWVCLLAKSENEFDRFRISFCNIGRWNLGLNTGDVNVESALQDEVISQLGDSIVIGIFVNEIFLPVHIPIEYIIIINIKLNFNWINIYIYIYVIHHWNENIFEW